MGDRLFEQSTAGGNATQAQNYLKHQMRLDPETLRDLFAAFAMQGLIANDQVVSHLKRIGDDSDPKAITAVAQAAYLLSDAMLKARGKHG